MTTDIAAMTRRGVTLMFRSPMTLSTSAFMPIILLLLLSVSFGAVVMPAAGVSDYVQFATPLFVTMGVVFGSISTAIAAQQDRISGFDDRLRTLPISPVAPLAGRIIADVGRNLVTLLLVSVVAMAMGFRFDNGIVGVGVYVVLPLVFGFGVAWFMVAVAMVADSAESTASLLNAVLLVLSFLSTGMVPIDDLPGWAQPVASANPISHIVEAMRSATTSGASVVGADAIVTVAWSAGLTVVCGYLAVRAYRRAR
ncbi:ABC transporter permease [Gordonia sp. ABSL11-1]|uniref:ABC transporter permease n=1 Tax=Gordonia sp. ABSL11-1 TaxID=3053924 RepID=UPI0025741CFA|nr:ABC transporter permease [Gordonia sp. ABSL11-1]MDL9947955.1 ABC transporter permease [Gordonia sp. ABSL11-1]